MIIEAGITLVVFVILFRGAYLMVEDAEQRFQDRKNRKK
jgi:hypothetical protein